MLLKSLLVLGAMLITGSSIAFADVPDPYGRPRPRPRPVMNNTVNIFSIPKIYVGKVEKDKINLVFYYIAPLKSTISFKFETSGGRILGTEVINVTNERDKFSIELPGPTDGNNYDVLMSSECHLRTVETKFGWKQVDKDIYSEKLSDSFKIIRDENGYVDFVKE